MQLISVPSVTQMQKAKISNYLLGAYFMPLQSLTSKLSENNFCVQKNVKIVFFFEKTKFRFFAKKCTLYHLKQIGIEQLKRAHQPPIHLIVHQLIQRHRLRIWAQFNQLLEHIDETK